MVIMFLITSLKVPWEFEFGGKREIGFYVV
jgi:hypothetical protein